MTPIKLNPAIRLVISLGIILATTSAASASWKEKVLYSFQGGTDGSTPAGGVVFDAAGNLYGATNEGGSSCLSPGCGTVFQLSPPATKGGTWSETILFGFSGSNGSFPAGSVIVDANGNLYGTTAYGGSGTCILLGGNVGCGVVYELSPPLQKGGHWTYSVLYNFQGGKDDGQYPWGNLTVDKAGNLYGATQFGGGKGYNNCNKSYGYCGTVYKLTPPKVKDGKWTEKVLHSFAGGTDGANPNGGLVLDSKGTIYGTTYGGGDEIGECGSGGCGTAFELDSPTVKGGAWTEKMLHKFEGPDDGERPAAGMIFDAKGHLYGTTLSGGTVFSLAPPAKGFQLWKKETLYTFNGDAYDPECALIFDQSGNLYGTTYSGNAFAGTVFRMKPLSGTGGRWTFAILYGFTGAPDGAQPAANLVFDEHGNLYSTTQKGGTGTCSFYGCGTVFGVSP